MVLLLLAISCAAVDAEPEAERSTVETAQPSEYAGRITPDQAVNVPGTDHIVTVITDKRTVTHNSSGDLPPSPIGHATVQVERGDQSQTLVVDLGKQYRVLGLNLRLHGTDGVYLVAGLGELSDKFTKVP